MPAENQSLQTEIDSAWKMSDEQIYTYLGISAAGTGNVQPTISDMYSLMSTGKVNNMEEAMSFRWGGFLEIGKSFFNQAWAGMRDQICQLHEQNSEVLDEKSLTSIIVTAIVGAAGITQAIAVLLVTLAVRQGLNMLCSVPQVE